MRLAELQNLPEIRRLSDTLSWAEFTAPIVFALPESGEGFGPDLISGQDYFDSIENITGGLGSDRLTGNGSANTLIGLEGGDTLKGGGGIDQLRGGLGLDKLNGGAGNDVFFYQALNESGTTSGTRDQISGFASGDRINVHAIDAKAGGVNDDFVLDTNNSFSQGEIRQTVQSGNLRLDFNADADAQAEMSIVLLNHAALLSNGDFVL